MTPVLDSVARQIAPGLMADRARRYEREVRNRHGVTALAHQLVGQGPAAIRGGPFAGMLYPENRLAEVDAPAAKLLGTYECELYPALQASLGAGVRKFIDVGCADGYYAVGMAYAGDDITTYAFDLSHSARDLCQDVARINGLTSRVHVGKRFSSRTLDSVNPRRALLLCDIEGAERALFDARLIARLAMTTVIIEVHTDGHPELSDELRAGFATSHAVVRVEQAEREAIEGVPPLATSEFRRYAQHWLVCRPLDQR